jgi:hypothetical protein
MGSCIVIVNYKWARWVFANHSYTDPMKLGIVNSLDFCSGDYKKRSMNVYFSLTSGVTGPVTHHTRITNHQYRPEMPHYVKRQTPNEYVHSLTQKCIGQKLLVNYFAVLTRDLNESHDTHSFQVFMTTNQLTIPLHASFGTYPLAFLIREMQTRQK